MVAIKRRGTPWVEYFSDKPWGRAAALRRARGYRDQLLARLPRATKVKRTYVLNTTGVVGVARVKEHTRETAHLLRSPANARRLLPALRRALGRKGRPQTPTSLRRALKRGA